MNQSISCSMNDVSVYLTRHTVIAYCGVRDILGILAGFLCYRTVHAGILAMLEYSLCICLDLGMDTFARRGHSTLQ